MFSSNGRTMPVAECVVCGSKKLLSKKLGICGECASSGSIKAMERALEVHNHSRLAFNLPGHPPHSENGVTCGSCANECVLGLGERGYCGLTENRNGTLLRLAGQPEKGLLDFYYDRLPTNCVADWCCPAGTGAGYPKFAHRKGPEYGFLNLAVFYGACSYDCLFCQNWHYRTKTAAIGSTLSAEQLARKVNDKVSCICYFGGDPAPQIAHSIAASEIACQNNRGKILRFCWETNGTENWQSLKRAADLSLASGGCIKFDLKAFSEPLNKVLCGFSNKRTLQNFKCLANSAQERRDPPFLVASTLLIPGYIQAEEVGRIAEFVAECDPTIPYSLLAFYPQYIMDDLPTTSIGLANDCLQAAKSAGLTRIRLGNAHLLS